MPNGVIVKVTDYGGIITELHTPDRNGALADIALGFDSVELYTGDCPYFGALIGRFGNRIGDGRLISLPATAVPCEMRSSCSRGRHIYPSVISETIPETASIMLKK